MPNQPLNIIQRLERELLPLQGYKAATGKLPVRVDLGPINEAFPHRHFPLGAVHEFVAKEMSNQVAAIGFITAILSSLMRLQGVVLWISTTRNIFPPALKHFGVDPHRIIFIHLKNEKQVAWALDEALKVNGLAAVVGEINQLDFTASRRFQLAVENSQVTGFLLNKNNSTKTSACLTRWQLTSLPSVLDDDLPGVGFPQWRVQLLKVRNGKPGSWDIQYRNGQLTSVHKKGALIKDLHKKTG